MHELGLAQEILDAVEAAVASRPGLKARLVRVSYGRLRGVEPEALKFAYDALSRGNSRLEGSVLELKEQPTRFCCAACGGISAMPDWSARCPACGSDQGEVSGGDEIVVESVEAEGPGEIED